MIPSATASGMQTHASCDVVLYLQSRLFTHCRQRHCQSQLADSSSPLKRCMYIYTLVLYICKHSRGQDTGTANPAPQATPDDSVTGTALSRFRCNCLRAEGQFLKVRGQRQRDDITHAWATKPVLLLLGGQRHLASCSNVHH
jgi:hypothetical protein